MRMRKKPYVPSAIEIVELEPLMLAERGEAEALEVPSNVERKR